MVLVCYENLLAISNSLGLLTSCVGGDGNLAMVLRQKHRSWCLVHIVLVWFWFVWCDRQFSLAGGLYGKGFGSVLGLQLKVGVQINDISSSDIRGGGGH